METCQTRQSFVLYSKIDRSLGGHFMRRNKHTHQGQHWPDVYLATTSPSCEPTHHDWSLL